MIERFDKTFGVQSGVITGLSVTSFVPSVLASAKRLALLNRSIINRGNFFMDERYREYLNSEAWKAKRKERLIIAKFRCAACNNSKGIEVHHLTYARIFNEDMQDLLPLCRAHHEKAEQLVAKGLLPRNGEVLFLATETVRLVSAHPTPKKKAKIPNAKLEYQSNALRPRNKIQECLMNEFWLENALKLKRKEFVKIVREKFQDEPRKANLIGNACALFDRNQNTKPLNGNLS